MRCLSVITQDGDSALMRAASSGKTDVVVELVKAGANLDLQSKVCRVMNSGPKMVIAMIRTELYVLHTSQAQMHLSALLF